jgi:SAM-dependent methyltransferase
LIGSIGSGVSVSPGAWESVATRFDDILQLTRRVGEMQTGKLYIFIENRRLVTFDLDLITSSQTTSSLFSQHDVTNQVHEGPPFEDSVLDRFVEQFVDLVKIAMATGKHVVRVLEIGARDGRLTKLLGQALVDVKLRAGYYVDYVCSDTEMKSAQKATSLSPWMTMTPVVFDPTVPIEEQGLEPATFDILVALDALHKHPNVHGTLSNLRGMLVPGGSLATIQWDSSSLATSAIGAKCKVVHALHVNTT